MVNSIYFKKIELNEGEAYNGIFGFYYILEITKIFWKIPCIYIFKDYFLSSQWDSPDEEVMKDKH